MTREAEDVVELEDEHRFEAEDEVMLTAQIRTMPASVVVPLNIGFAIVLKRTQERMDE